ncbi:unnamed protein product [Rangifer tarandus platyrhynchus]|uniref:Uncharacterized protein n=2 Tax=Rangifer tarandus platyrhynchus TaxID=3082113 RepID=A0ACB0ENY2_RANTA|nr:unnamed protein product [Rangifer tarandus platyrhynchus]CAI9702341.1 unnamed protein product [Rangifer tarandus platyrhynchus]
MNSLLQFGYVLNLFAYQLFSQMVSNLLEATFLIHLTDCDVDPPQSHRRPGIGEGVKGQVGGAGVPAGEETGLKDGIQRRRGERKEGVHHSQRGSEEAEPPGRGDSPVGRGEMLGAPLKELHGDIPGDFQPPSELRGSKARVTVTQPVLAARRPGEP